MREGPRAVNGILWLGAQALGAGVVLFSLPAIVAPRLFGRLTGLSVGDDPAGSVAVRSVAARDVAMGVGLVAAARGHRPLRPWLALRFCSDGADVVGCALAFLTGGGNRRLGVLGAVALGATLCDAALYTIARDEEEG